MHASKAPLTPLDETSIHLWFCQPSLITDNALLDRYKNLLNTEEMQRYWRFHFDKDRHRHLVTRALIRTTLSEYDSNIAPEAWTFSHNDYGKPSIDPPTQSNISFNISHTQDLIVAALTIGADIGVDIENMREKNRIEGLIDHCFNDTEKAYINDKNKSVQVKRFFELWTLKESYMKAYGKGLAIPLKDLTFSQSNDNFELSISGRHKDTPKHWHFFQTQIKQNYQLSLCYASNGHDQKRTVTHMDTVPLK